jgi:hypothetical protein
LPAPRQELGVAELAGRIYAVGGFDDSGGPTGVVEYYEPGSDQWLVAASLPEPLHHIPVAAVSNRLYALGGLRGGAFTAVDVVSVYDPGRDAWEAGPSLPMPRGAGAAAVINGPSISPAACATAHPSPTSPSSIRVRTRGRPCRCCPRRATISPRRRSRAASTPWVVAPGNCSTSSKSTTRRPVNGRP